MPKEFIAAERKIKKFRKYGIGYLHIDLLYTPKINKKRSYICAVIDRIAKIAFIMLGERKTKEAGARFLREIIEFYPYKINYILTDNSFEFSKALPKIRKRKRFILLTKYVKNIKSSIAPLNLSILGPMAWLRASING